MAPVAKSVVAAMMPAAPMATVVARRIGMVGTGMVATVMTPGQCGGQCQQCPRDKLAAR